MTAWPSCEVPAIPNERGYESSAEATLLPRYEDITQDGRVQLHAITPGLGAVWRMLGSSDKLDSFRAQGILPILRRLVVRGESGPFSVHSPLHVSGTWRLAREREGERIFLGMWLEVRAPHGSTLASPPAHDAERVLVGRVYAEHIVTRPFAPPAERKVTRLDAPGLPAVPEDLLACEEAEDLVAGHALTRSGDHVFGLLHTDSNQHVNSLVYPRLFEEAVVRDLSLDAARDVPNPTELLVRAIELRYRKPFFAGDRAEVALVAGRAASADGHRAAAVGTFAPFGRVHASANAKPSCSLAMWLG